MLDPLHAFLEVASRHGEIPAIVEQGLVTTYADLEFLARRFAGEFIREASAHPKVAICLPQTAAAYASMFGAMLAGGFYAPVNIGAPLDRQRQILSQFDPEVIVAEEGSVGAYSSIAGRARVVTSDISAEPLCDPRPGHDLVYVIFTSGTTGKPKGVRIRRASLGHYASWARRAMRVQPGERWSQHPNIGFDLSVLDIFGALTAGASLYPLQTKMDRLLPGAFAGKNRLEIWNSVPSLIDLMIRGRCLTTANFKSVRLMTFCGEPLLKRHLDAIFEAAPHVVVHNTYGPTEATVSCTLEVLDRESYRGKSKSSVVLGQPIDGMHLRIGEEESVGEILIAGPQVADGYWDNPEETSARFFEMECGGEMLPAYRSGDWAELIGEDMYFSNRIDDQVKIRGNRVELGEIEATISHLFMCEAYVVVVDEELHCAVTQDSKLDLIELRARLSDVLPEYELPSSLKSLDRIPVNVNGKVDRRQLRETISAKLKEDARDE